MSGEIETTARGHLAADAVIKTVHGKNVCELRLAVGVRRKDSAGDWQELRTDWVDVSAWNYLAGTLATLKRGTLVVVIGTLTPGAYLSQAGEAVPTTKILASAVYVVPRPPRDAVAVPDRGAVDFAQLLNTPAF